MIVKELLVAFSTDFTFHSDDCLDEASIVLELSIDIAFDSPSESQAV